MNVPSIIIVAFLFVLVGLAIWRNVRKGAPCSCGGCGACGHEGDSCHCHEKGKQTASHEKKDLLN